MHFLVKKVMDLEEEAENLNQKLSAITSILIKRVSALILFKMEYKPEMDLELYESYLIIYNDYIRELKSETSQTQNYLELTIDKLDNLY